MKTTPCCLAHQKERCVRREYDTWLLRLTYDFKASNRRLEHPTEPHAQINCKDKGQAFLPRCVTVKPYLRYVCELQCGSRTCSERSKLLVRLMITRARPYARELESWSKYASGRVLHDSVTHPKAPTISPISTSLHLLSLSLSNPHNL